MVKVSLAEEHLNQAVYLLSSTTVLAILYTLVSILYCLSFRLCYGQLWDHHGKIKRQRACTLALLTVLLICATLDVIACNRVAQVVFIDNSTPPDGPLGPVATLNVATLQHLDAIVDTVGNFLILGVLLWRVRVVWSGTGFVVPLTIVSLFFYLANAGSVILMNMVTWNIFFTSLVATPRAKMIIFIMTSVFSLASFAFMTSSIIARLLFFRRKHVKLMGKSDIAGQYLSIATMLIESYALDTLWAFGSVISFGLKYSPTMNLFTLCATQIDILTNFLLIYRVLSGRAWDRQTQDRLSTLRWASNGARATICGTVELRQTSIREEDPSVINLHNGV